MEFKDLEIFQTVAQKGTVTEAAKELRYVQSNITSRIQKLETELNTPLFNRHNRGMSLTPEGKKLLVYCEKILSLTNEMKKVVQSKERAIWKTRNWISRNCHQTTSNFICLHQKV